MTQFSEMSIAALPLPRWHSWRGSVAGEIFYNAVTAAAAFLERNIKNS
jgi:hypothetical protein